MLQIYRIKAKEDNFPSEILDLLRAQLTNLRKQNTEPKLEVELRLTCTTGLEEAIDENSINDFAITLKEFVKIFGLNERILNFENLRKDTFIEEQSLQAILLNKDLVSLMTDNAIIQFAVYSETAANMVNDLPHLRSRLEAINVGVDKQTFTSSCAARTIMKLLLDTGLLPEKDYNAATELKIYKKIWTQPGGFADPMLLISLLKAINTDLVGIIFDDTIAKTFNLSNDPSLHIGFSIFHKETPQIATIQKPADYQLPLNTVALVMVDSGQLDGGHLVFCKQQADGKIDVTNPSNGTCKTYSNFEEMMQDEKGLGVIFQVPLNKMQKEKILEHSTFYNL